MSEDRVIYQIAYEKKAKTVIAYPLWRGPRGTTAIIGEFQPQNPRSNLEDYKTDLLKAVSTVLKAHDPDEELYEYRITVIPLDGTPEVVLKKPYT